MTAVAERDRLVDITERCGIVGYGRSLTYQREAEGKVRGYKVGRRKLYSENEAYAEVAAIKAARAARERQSAS